MKKPIDRPKPPLVVGAMDMSHVPPPNPENFWRLQLDEPRVIMLNPDGMEPMLTIVVREIKGNQIALQIVANPKMRQWGPS